MVLVIIAGMITSSLFPFFKILLTLLVLGMSMCVCMYLGLFPYKARIRMIEGSDSERIATLITFRKLERHVPRC